MSISLKTTKQTEDVAEFIADSILDKLKHNKKVLFFATGGSSIPIYVKISEILNNSEEKKLLRNLVVALTDERYGEVGHANSNWHQLIKQGFNLPGATIVPVLIGEDFDTTIKKFSTALGREFKKAEYKIGLFGVGADGHTAGIMPSSAAVGSQGLVCGYSTPIFSRITITPKAIGQLDEAVVFTRGEEKWDVVRDLLEKDINIEKQPAQILKQVPLLTIFSDYSRL